MVRTTECDAYLPKKKSPIYRRQFSPENYVSFACWMRQKKRKETEAKRYNSRIRCTNWNVHIGIVAVANFSPVLLLLFFFPSSVRPSKVKTIWLSNTSCVCAPCLYMFKQFYSKRQYRYNLIFNLIAINFQTAHFLLSLFFSIFRSLFK